MTTNTEEIFEIPFAVIRLLSKLVSKYYIEIASVKELLSHIDETKYREVSQKIEEPRTIEEIGSDPDVINSSLVGAPLLVYNNEKNTYLGTITTQFLNAINSKNDTKEKLFTLIDDVKNHIQEDDDKKLNECLLRNKICF